MNIKNKIKFYPKHAPRIKSGEKHTTIRRDSDCKSGEIRELITTEGDFIADCVIRKITVFPISSEKTTSIPLERVKKILKSEGFKSWIELVKWIEEQYEIPFFGLLIEWELL
jgi:hypothetical protein